MAMNRKVATIETGFKFSGLDTAKGAITRFVAGVKTALGGVKGDSVAKAGRDGARGLDRANDSAKKLSASLKDVVDKAKTVSSLGRSLASRAATVAGVGVLGGAIGGAVQGGIVGKAVSGNKEIGESIERQAAAARAMGMSIEEFSLLDALGRRFRVETDDLAGAMVGFSNALSDAAKGEGAAGEWFGKLGLSATDAEGRLKPITAQMREVARVAQGMQGAEKASFLSAMFGEGDALKIATMIDALGQMDEQTFNDTAIGLAKQGGIFTAEDAKNAQMYRISMEQLGDAWRRLKRAILAATGPQLQQFFWVISRLVVTNADLIANKLSVALGHMIRLFYDLILVAFGYQPVKHSWLSTIGQGTTLAIAAVKAFIAFLPTALTFAKDAWYILTFQDSKASGENPGLRRLRDQIVQFGLWLAQKGLELADAILFQIGLALGQLNVIFLQLKLALLEIKVAWESGFAASDSNPIARMIAEISQALTWLQALKTSLRDVFLLDGQAQPGFEWVETAKQKWDEFAAKLATAWDWLKTIFSWWEKVFGFFGIDLKTTLLFVGLLKMLGLLWMLTIPLKTVGALVTGFLTGLAQGITGRLVGGAVGGAAAGGGMAALISGIGAAIKGFGAACLAAMPLVAQFAVVAAAMFAAFQIGGGIGSALANWWGDFDTKIKSIAGTMKANDEIYMRNKGLIDGAGQYTDLARSQLSGTALSPALQNAAMPSDLAPVNIYWKGDDAYPAQFYAQQSEIQKLLTADQFSLTR